MTRLRTISGILDDLTQEYTTPIGSAVSGLIETQMTAYPIGWTDEERREMAELHLFGKTASLMGEEA